MKTPPVMFVPTGNSAPWSVEAFRDLIGMGHASGTFGKFGSPFIAFLEAVPDQVIAEELRFRDGPSVAQVMFERMLADTAEHQLRIERPLANETRKRNENRLRGPKGGPKKPPKWREAAREFKQLTDAGMSDVDAVRRLDPKHFDRARLVDSDKASKRAETYKRWVADL